MPGRASGAACTIREACHHLGSILTRPLTELDRPIAKIERWGSWMTRHWLKSDLESSCVRRVCTGGHERRSFGMGRRRDRRPRRVRMLASDSGAVRFVTTGCRAGEHIILRVGVRFSWLC